MFEQALEDDFGPLVEWAYAREQASGAGGGAIYGDGSDGDLVLQDGELWTPGFYRDVLIEEGATVGIDWEIANVWPIFRCTGTWRIDGTLDLAGIDATGLAGGQSPYGDGVGASGTQNSGETSVLIEAGSLISGPLLICEGTPMGGAGGDGAFGGGDAPEPTVFRQFGPNSPIVITDRSIANVPVGGSSGGGDGVNYGGGGGGAGVWAIVVARHIEHGPNNLYLVNGGAGAPGGDDGNGDTGNGDCGGGGGGGAGYWMTMSDTIDDEPANINTVGNHSFAGTGGAGGAGCGTGTDGADGDDGFVVRLLNT